ncbi:hypothetical protein J2T59_000645 [Methanosalsum natronophilum]|nr:hypothetical protein [Methanosalsum natronophilum]
MVSYDQLSIIKDVTSLSNTTKTARLVPIVNCTFYSFVLLYLFLFCVGFLSNITEIRTLLSLMSGKIRLGKNAQFVRVNKLLQEVASTVQPDINKY